MILIDSSAFIEFYRPRGKASVRKAVAEAIASGEASVNGIIMVEIVPFAADEAGRRRLRLDFESYRWLELPRADFDLAEELGSRLRGKGITVPATDLIIAANAIHAGATLFHADEDFDRIAGHSDLDARNLGTA